MDGTPDKLFLRNPAYPPAPSGAGGLLLPAFVYDAVKTSLLRRRLIKSLRIKGMVLLVAIMPLITCAQLTPRLTSSRKGPIGFYEFKPRGYNGDSSYKYPLLIFLHGVGERGNGTTDLPVILTASYPKLLAAHATMNFTVNGRQHAFVVLLPQMSKDYWNWQNFYIDAMIDYAKANLNIDENKVFLTGWSLGGGGAWKYVTASVDSANRIAGIIPVSPAPNYTNLCNIKKGHVAVWAHHAKRDTYVPPPYTDYAIKTINACSPGGIPALVEFYVHGGHNFVGDYAYDTLNTFHYPNIYQWMIGITRASTPENNKPPIPLAGHDTTIFLPSLRAVLNGIASYDPNDVIVQYTWSLVAGTAGTLKIDKPDYPATTVEGLAPGAYTFRLTVKDEFGITRFDDITVHVTLPPNGLNAPPLANAGPDIETTAPEYHIHAMAKDFDGTIRAYKWRQVSGPAPVTILGRGDIADVVGMTVLGTYGIELTAFDNHTPSGIGKDTMLITKNTFYPVSVFYWTTKISGIDLGTNIHFTAFLVLLITIILPASAFSYRVKQKAFS